MIPRDSLPALCAELGMYEDNGVAIVNSRDVAAQFTKQHKHVLRDIDGIPHGPDLDHGISGWFREVLHEHPTIPGRMDRSIDMTRDGFMLVVFGWTGPKAMAVKVKYIHGFNLMYEFIRKLDRDLIHVFRDRLADVDHQLKELRETTQQFAEAARLQAATMPGLIEDIVQKKFTNDSRAVMGDGFLPALYLAVKAGAKPKGRRTLIIRMSNELEARCLRLDKPIHYHQHTGTKLFPYDVCASFMRNPDNAWARGDEPARDALCARREPGRPS